MPFVRAVSLLSFAFMCKQSTCAEEVWDEIDVIGSACFSLAKCRCLMCLCSGAFFVALRLPGWAIVLHRRCSAESWIVAICSFCFRCPDANRCCFRSRFPCWASFFRELQSDCAEAAQKDMCWCHLLVISRSSNAMLSFECFLVSFLNIAFDYEQRTWYNNCVDGKILMSCLRSAHYGPIQICCHAFVRRLSWNVAFRHQQSDCAE